MLNSDFSLDYIITNSVRMSLSKHRLDSNVLWREKNNNKKEHGQTLFSSKVHFWKGKGGNLAAQHNKQYFYHTKEIQLLMLKGTVAWNYMNTNVVYLFFLSFNTDCKFHKHAHTHAHSLIPIRKINSPTLSPKHRKNKTKTELLVEVFPESLQRLKKKKMQQNVTGAAVWCADKPPLLPPKPLPPPTPDWTPAIMTQPESGPGGSSRPTPI